MSDIDKIINALLDCLNGRLSVDQWDALTALVAERDKLVEDNASQTYKGNSVRYWHDKASAYRATIGSLWEILESAAVCPDGERTITASLTALVAERNSLRAKLAAAKDAQRDAERYRWLKSAGCQWITIYRHPSGDECFDGKGDSRLDERIDAARSRDAEGGGA